MVDTAQTVNTETPICTIKDAADFWQAVETAAYAMEGESADYALERMKWLGRCLDSFLRAHPEISCAPDAPLKYFAMHAMARLACAFVFNSEVVPSLRALMDEQVLRRLDERQQFDDDDDGEPYPL